MKKLLFGLMAALLLTAPAYALIEVEAYYWYMFPDGTHSLGDGSRAGTTLDLESDLGYEDGEGLPGFTAIVGDEHQLGVNYFSMDMSASRRLTRDARFGGLEFPERTKVSSDWNAQFTRAYYRLNLGSSFARAGIIGGVQHINYDADLSAPTVGKATEDVAAILPIIGAYCIAHPLPFLGLRGSGVGSRWSYDDVSATFIDVELAAEMTFVGGAFAAAGYRHLSIDASDDEDPSDLDVTLSGPVIYLGIEW